MNSIEQALFKNCKRLENEIDKYTEYLTLSEYNMLMLLNRNSLLLDIKKESDEFGITRILASDLERKYVLVKVVDNGSKD